MIDLFITFALNYVSFVAILSCRKTQIKLFGIDFFRNGRKYVELEITIKCAVN